MLNFKGGCSLCSLVIVMMKVVLYDRLLIAFDMSI
jgi:hypothetical protein